MADKDQITEAVKKEFDKFLKDLNKDFSKKDIDDIKDSIKS
jgi:hypothetical protein